MNVVIYLPDISNNQLSAVNFSVTAIRYLPCFEIVQKIYSLYLCEYRYIITINVPLFKNLRDITFFLRDNNFLSHFEGHFEGAMTFLTP
jgi:hypothetical protein